MMSERVADAFEMKKMLRKNNERLKMNMIQFNNRKSKKTKRTGVSEISGSRLNRTLEEESNADDLTKEYLSNDDRKSTRNLDQRAARSAIDEEYQQFLK